MNRPEQVRTDRFAVANAAFWLDTTRVSGRLAEANYADRFTAEPPPARIPVTVIAGQAAAARRAVLSPAEAVR